LLEDISSGGVYMETNYHDAVCEVCGEIIPCCESGCVEPPMHDYICEECIRLEQRTKPLDSHCAIMETRFDD